MINNLENKWINYMNNIKKIKKEQMKKKKKKIMLLNIYIVKNKIIYK